MSKAELYKHSCIKCNGCDARNPSQESKFGTFNNERDPIECILILSPAIIYRRHAVCITRHDV